MNDSPIKIRFNGQPFELPSGSTVQELLRLADVRTNLVAVEINLDVVPRKQHDQRVVNDGDQVEVVTLVGGG